MYQTVSGCDRLVQAVVPQISYSACPILSCGTFMQGTHRVHEVLRLRILFLHAIGLLALLCQ